MAKYKTRGSWYIYFLIIFFISCTLNTSKKRLNDFCHSSYVEDVLRIPLIEPFELSNISGPWGLYFQDTGFGEYKYFDDEILSFLSFKTVSYVSYIQVSKPNYIILLSINPSYKKNFEIDTAYFILDIKNNSRKYYFEKRLISKYLKDNYKVEKTTLYNVDSIYKEFKKNGEVPWCSDTTSKEVRNPFSPPSAAPETPHFAAVGSSS